MVLVKVNRVSSYTDIETGKPGKQIELVEVRRRGGQRMGQGHIGEEAQMIQSILSQMQSYGFVVPQARDIVLPKLTIILSEDEYDLLGVRFEVNDMYEMTMKDGSLTFTKATESSAGL
jgi:hypothetical protein